MLYCATDKEIFDILMSSKQQFSESALLDVARLRGLLLSPQDSREEIADRLSTMLFGYREIRVLQAEFERTGRGEKTTSFRLNGSITTEEIRKAALEYCDAAGEDEIASAYSAGPSNVSMDVKYVETDFSKTRLRQRRRREARIDIQVGETCTIVTLPATEKARSVAEDLRARIVAAKSESVVAEEVDLSELHDPLLRTRFFTDLISTLPDLSLVNVTRVKVDRFDEGEHLIDGGDEDDGDGENDAASEEMLGIVRAVALQGESLLSSTEYQSLHSRGFFISSITWTCKRTEAPYQQVQFEAGFDEPSQGRGFKYGVRGWHTQRGGDYTKTLRPIPTEDKRAFLATIEGASTRVMAAIKQDAASRACDAPDGGGSE